MIGCVLLGALAACTTTPAAEEEQERRVGLSFIQQRIDEGTPRAQLRVVNRGDEELTVTGVGLDWAGYGGTWRQDYATTVQPGQTLDLRMRLPEPVCNPTEEAARGVVEVDGRAVTDELDASGRAFLRRVWRRACAEQYVDQRVLLEYGNTWRLDGSGRGTGLVGSLELTRLDSDEEIRVVEMLGSVLIDITAPRPAVLLPDARRGSFPLRLSPARCDEHALGQSTQTFVFRARVRIGGHPPVVVIVEPDRPARRSALRMLYAACR